MLTERSDASESSAIPRVFHWVWLGGAQIPPEHVAWMEGWHALHPGWSRHVWRDGDIPPLRNQAAFDAARSWAQKADIVRYELLLDHGGVYLDTDMQCLRNIEPLLDGATAVVGLERDRLLGNSVLAASPGHPWMAAAVAGIPDAMTTHWLTLDQTGPSYLTRLTEGRSDVRVLPPVTFYPFPSTAPGGSLVPPPDSYAVHHWAKSWAESEVTHMRENAAGVLARLLQPGDSAVIVDENIDVPVPHGCQRLPFLSRDGVDWGLPADDDAAVTALEAHRAAGVQWVVLLASAYWWLDHYTGLAKALQTHASQVFDEQYLTAYRLG